MSGGEVAGERSSSSDGAREEEEEEEDRISALPDDVLVLFLLRLDTAADAARTGVLSRRWRRVWRLLPELRFPTATDPRRIRAVLSAHGADLRRLLVKTQDAAPDAVAACLRAAAPRLTGGLSFVNVPPARRNAPANEEEEEEDDRGAFELPCFDRAAIVNMDLGFLGLAVPPAGVLGAHLCHLWLRRVRFHGPCELGDAVSSPRWPRLKKLHVDDARGLLNLAIHSESLVEVRLTDLRGLLKLTLVAPKLRLLGFLGSLADGELVANISAPQLESLQWSALYDPSSVQFGEMAHLRQMITSVLGVYESHYSIHNHSVVSLLERFRQFTGELSMPLMYPHPHDIGNFQYLMEDLTVLPDLEVLKLSVFNNGHSFGGSVSHVLRMCVGLKELNLHMLNCSSGMEAQSACPQGCFCGEPSNWMTEELTLNCLQHVEISGMRGADHEVTFLKRLFHWATLLETIEYNFLSFGQ